MKKMDGIQILFELIIELCKLITGNNIAPASPRPLSPEMRQELVTFISKTQEQISALEKDRQSIYNRNRHKKSEALNAEARDITAKIKPLRRDVLPPPTIAGRFIRAKNRNRRCRSAPATFCYYSTKMKYCWRSVRRADCGAVYTVSRSLPTKKVCGSGWRNGRLLPIT